MREIKFRAWDKIINKMYTKIDSLHPERADYVYTGTDNQDVINEALKIFEKAQKEWVWDHEGETIAIKLLKDAGFLKSYEDSILSDFYFDGEVLVFIIRVLKQISKSLPDNPQSI